MESEHHGAHGPLGMASQHALRLILGHELDRSPEALDFGVDEFGKPYLVNESRLRFNVSHSGHHALIGVTSSWEIGVDIEVIDAVIDVAALVGMHFTEDERLEWARTTAPMRDEAFLACWTRKEACVKALGVGLLLQPSSLNVGCAPGERVVGIQLGSSAMELTVRTVNPVGGVAAAVALVAPGAARSARHHFRSSTR